MEKFKESYNADLANGIGNLAARILMLSQTNLAEAPRFEVVEFPKEYTDALDTYDYNAATDYIWQLIKKLDGRLTSEKPFAVVKTDPEAGKRIIAECVVELRIVATLLQPFMPATSEALVQAISANQKPVIYSRGNNSLS